MDTVLVVDCGNTNTVFAVFDDRGALIGEWRSSTSADRTADEYWAWLSQLWQLDGIDRGTIRAAIVATVVPSALFNLKLLCRKHLRCEPLIVGQPTVRLGIEILVDRPEEVGADRLVNAVAAFQRYGGPLIVLDFGTATTFDVVGKDGSYCGGVIAPGINLSLEALHRAAAKLPTVAIARPPQVIGKDTISAMQSGIFWGYVGMIEGVVQRIRREFGSDLEVVATGGLAPLFEGVTEAIRHVDAELTLRGLFYVYRRNVAP